MHSIHEGGKLKRTVSFFSNSLNTESWSSFLKTWTMWRLGRFLCFIFCCEWKPPQLELMTPIQSKMTDSFKRGARMLRL